MALTPPHNAPSYSHILSLLSRCTHLSHLKQLQAHAIVHRHGASQLLAFQLIRFASLSLSDLPYARRLFDAMPEPNVFLYTAMLTAYISCGHHRAMNALDLFLRMLRRSHPKPNEFVYPLVLRAACNIAGSDIHLVRLIHSHTIKTGFGEYSVIKTSLLDGYSRFGMMDTARELFDCLPERNVVSWTALVSGYARAGKVGDSIVLFEGMPERDVPAWNAVIAGCAQNGLFLEAVGIFRRMVGEGFKPNGTTVSCVLSACSHLGMLKVGKLVHGYVSRSHIDFSSSVVNALIDMYGKCGNLKEARWIFYELSDRTRTTWNSLINCLALHGHSKCAIAAFDEMKAEGVQPDEVTFVGLLNACNHGGFVKEGLAYFELMRYAYEIEPEIEHYGCVVDLLGRAGRFQDAVNIIKDMKVEPDEVIWGSLLNGCRIHGQTEVAMFAIRKLLDLNPSNANYVAMLANLYSECGLWEEVRKIRKVMKEVGGKKLPGCSWIEVDHKTRQFYSGDDAHPESEDIYNALEDLSASMET